MANVDPTPERVLNEEVLTERRVRLELAYVWATLRSGGVVEDEKSKNCSDFIKKMMPVIMDGTWLTS